MDKPTRSLIQNATQDARRLLEQEFREQLQGTFDIIPDTGAIAPQPGAHLDARQRFIRSRIVAAIHHERAKSAGDAEAVQGYLREAAFTTLNRFAALKLMEARRIVQECVSRGEQSAGFREFAGLAPGLATLPDHGYRLYLECLFDEIGTELGVLFDRRDPASLLWPRRSALLSLLDILNRAELATVNIWAEDETIGWIYQYFNDEAERRQMRDESAAPRNSRELAVRNQFFTPRYVVQFLSDNTLGRIWYEMTKGQTKLKDHCRYLIRRPNEIFLNPGETPPATTTPSAAKDSPSPPSEGGEGRGEVGPSNPQSAIANPQSQEELLRQPVHIPHRPLKDPREIRMLDPACGSMHFGLYAFDLYEIIYAEAWDNHPELLTDLRAELSTLNSQPSTPEQSRSAFLRLVPKLIIEHNIHGIDIDPRAVQIAGLSLWLRAQRAWQEQGVKPADRPPIRKSNVVCAEPMPGEPELLSEFVEQEFPAAERPVFSHLLAHAFAKMKLAGEAGSLLKIEEEIRSAIAEARAQWQAARKAPDLFRPEELAALDRRPGAQQELPVPTSGLRPLTSGISDEQFWERLENGIYEALEKYAAHAQYGAGFQRRLFAEDAARGFAFIDICSKHYDLALMNPPFGDASLPSKSYLDETYGDTKGDVYKAFVECFQARLVPAGYLGIISSRTGFFLGQSEDWRTRVVLRLFRPIALADLGMGVLDAMVEVAAYVLRNLSKQEARELTLSLVPVLNKVVLDGQQRFSLPKWQAARDGLRRHQAVAELAHLEAHGFIQRCPGDIVRYTPLWRAVKVVTAPPEPVFPPLVCIRVLAEEDKGAVLTAAITREADPQKFVCDPAGFAAMPGSPFAYWSSTSIRTLGQRLPHYEPAVGSVKVGVQTDDDFRFVRAWWEVTCRRDPDSPSAEWTPFLKGDSASSFHDDIRTVLSWANQGRELKQFVTQVLNGGHWSRHVFNSEFYFRPGISWALRTARFAPSCVPSGCIPSVSRYLAVADRYSTLAVVGLWNSSIHDALCKLRMERHGHPKFIVGVVKATPFPLLSSEEENRLAELSRRAWSYKRGLAMARSTSHAFALPALLATASATLADRAASWAASVRTSEETVAAIQAEIDDLAFRLYGLDAADRAALMTTVATESTTDAAAEAGEDEAEEATSADGPALVADLLSYALGASFGRWDIRYATGEKAAPDLPDPFAPLPVCPPGQLQSAQGLPLTKEEFDAQFAVNPGPSTLN